MKKILFVCTGNTCRSPMAAGLLRKMLGDAGVPDVLVESAGLSAMEGFPASPGAVAAAGEAGVDLSGHRARRAFSLSLSEYGAIYVMSEQHRMMLEMAEPDLQSRVQVLGNGIPDPFGGDLAEYRACLESLRGALAPILRELKNDGTA